MQVLPLGKRSIILFNLTFVMGIQGEVKGLLTDLSCINLYPATVDFEAISFVTICWVKFNLLD
jgi:hypothetical protein